MSNSLEKSNKTSEQSKYSFDGWNKLPFEKKVIIKQADLKAGFNCIVKQTCPVSGAGISVVCKDELEFLTGEVEILEGEERINQEIRDPKNKIAKGPRAVLGLSYTSS